MAEVRVREGRSDAVKKRTDMRCSICRRPVGGNHHQCRSEARERELAALYQSGCTLAEIGKEVGLSPERVRQLIWRTGVPSYGHGNRRLSMEQAAKAIRLPNNRRRAGLEVAGRSEWLAERRKEKRSRVIAAIREIYDGTPVSLSRVALAMGFGSAGELHGLCRTAWQIASGKEAWAVACAEAGAVPRVQGAHLREWNAKRRQGS